MYNNFGGQEGNGGLFQGQGNSKVFTKAPSLSTADIKMIVDGLNRPPFMSNLSLVEFDDKAPLELLELLNRLLGHLNSEHLSVDIQRETQDKTQERICGFLKVLGYPSDFNPNFQRDVVHGEKKTIQHLLFWIVTKLPELQRRAYTAKFLVPLEIPDEFLGDDEMRETFQTYKDLQAEFQATHQNVDQMRVESMNPTELKKEIN
jgi:intraflagellar transport protein 81